MGWWGLDLRILGDLSPRTHATWTSIILSEDSLDQPAGAEATQPEIPSDAERGMFSESNPAAGQKRLLARPFLPASWRAYPSAPNANVFLHFFILRDLTCRILVIISTVLSHLHSQPLLTTATGSAGAST